MLSNMLSNMFSLDILWLKKGHFVQVEKSTIVRLYHKYIVDFRMFGYDSQVKDFYFVCFI